jgi:hypothetical protein
MEKYKSGRVNDGMDPIEYYTSAALLGSSRLGLSSFFVSVERI